MTGPGYVMMETSKIRRYAPEFQHTLRELEARVLENTVMVWSGLSYGGLTPREKQFGRTTFLPQFFRDQNADVLDKNHSPSDWGRNTFRILYNSTYPTAVAVPGWKTIWEGAATGATTPEDIRMAWAGLAFTSEEIHVTKIRFLIGDTRYPIMDIEELYTYNMPSMIFEEGFEIPEETFFQLRGWFEQPGKQRIIPLGFVYYRRKDSVLTE
jgi:hypothetical protein